MCRPSNHPFPTQTVLGDNPTSYFLVSCDFFDSGGSYNRGSENEFTGIEGTVTDHGCDDDCFIQYQ
jgi:hypothetical protein